MVFGNLHAMCLEDMNGDGKVDLVTGSRFWAHNGNDEADREKAPVYWYESRVGKDGKVRWRAHEVDGHSGVVTQVVCADVDGNGKPDIVVGNKMGIFLHLQKEGPATEEPDDDGLRARGADGRVLNLDFESGDLRDWSAEGNAFEGQPIRGDTVFPRRSDSRSQHEGEYWVGTYEPHHSDSSVGMLTSTPFVVEAPWASFLVGGGQGRDTRVEITDAEGGKVLHSFRGRNRENMEAVLVDLEEHLGKSLRIRLVDQSSGGWGHINFDHFRLWRQRPDGVFRAKQEFAEEQTTGFSPTEAVKRMKVPEGFAVDLIAGEPDLHQPIAMAIDEKGRLWVAEAHSYPTRRAEGEGKDQILVFSFLGCPPIPTDLSSAPGIHG